MRPTDPRTTSTEHTRMPTAQTRAKAVSHVAPSVSQPQVFTPSPTPPLPDAREPVGVATPGTRIHQYELIRQLGSGGMGTVFLARDTRLGRRVAIKFLHTPDADTTQRFVLEARATARCSHENIVIIYEVGEFQGSPFMVLEYLQGQPLNKLISRQRLPPSRVVELLVPVVRALACAHEQGIVHRDLKPDNILVTDTGAIKVLDFGIAKVLQAPEHPPENATAVRLRAAAAAGDLPPTLDSSEDPVNLTRRGAIVGTLSYMSPEQWRGSGIDHRTDLWAIGIMLFRMLAGKHPLDPLRGSQLAVTGILEEPMPRLRTMAPEVPQALADIVDRCLLKDKEQRFADATALLRALESFLPGRYSRELRIDESPYAGLASFQEDDADRFFGRTREIAALVHRIQEQPLIAVVGPSGAGKSSFVRAGLVPILKRSAENWETIVIRPGRKPLAALAHVMAPLLSSSTSLADDLEAQQKLVQRLHAEPGYVGAVLRARARREKRKILLFIDQFEELYTLVPDAHERRAFTACLSGIADDATTPIRLVLSLRSDFLDRVPEDERFMGELSQGLFFLTAPSREGLKEALQQPAELAGYRFETSAMVDDMLAYLESAQGALPLLQFAATQLWNNRDQARKLLTQESYQSVGGIAGALATHADSVLNELPFQTRTLARSVFLALVTPERTRAIVPLEELRGLTRDAKEIRHLIDHLVQARLLVVQTGGGSTSATVELVHESLLNSWPTLKRWLDEGQEDAAFLEQLRSATRQWQSKGRDRELLWRGELAEEARRFQRRHRGELPEAQQAFLEAVLAQAAQTTRRKQLLGVSAIVFLVLLVAASGVALVRIREAKQEAERQTVIARESERMAHKHLAESQAKSEALQEAQKKTAQARDEVQAALEAQRLANEEQARALAQATEARQNASQATKRALKHAKAAKEAKDRAERSKQQLELKLREELKRQRTQTGKDGPVPHLNFGLEQ